MEARVPARLTRQEGRKFGLQVGAAFLVITGVLIWRDHIGAAYVTATLGTLLVIGGLLIPGQLGPVHRAWMGFGLLLSKVTTPIFMGLVFFGVLGPTGLLRRTLGSNQVVRPRNASTYWIDRAATEKRSNLERQF